MRKFAETVIKKRGIILGIVIGITVIFTGMIREAPVNRVMLADFLPPKHPYMKYYNEFKRDIEGEVVIIMVEAKKGDIFNQNTLGKIMRITESLIYDFPGVDRSRVYSLGSREMKNFQVTEKGFQYLPIMFPRVPESSEQMFALKKAIYSSEFYCGTLVSHDGKGALINLGFLEGHKVDYHAFLNKFKELRKIEEDDNTIISLFGEGIEQEYVRLSLKHNRLMVLLTGSALIFLLYGFFKTFSYPLISIFFALIQAIWGLGIINWFGFKVDPFFIIFPLIITVTQLSHFLHYTRCFQEELLNQKDVKMASARTLEKLFIPGLLSIGAVALGFLIISVIPIPLLKKTGISCFLWAFFPALILIPIFIPLLLSFLPPVRTERKHTRKHTPRGWLDFFLPVSRVCTENGH